MSAKHKNRYYLNSLNFQIYAAEQKLVQQRLVVSKNSSHLLYDLQQRIISPTNLVLAGEVGFMFAELTKQQTLNTSLAIKPNNTTKTTALSFIETSIAFLHELNASLPIILIAKSYFESRAISHRSKNRHATVAEKAKADQGYRCN